MARTQQERREATVAGLLDAAIATIAEIGYARASAKKLPGVQEFLMGRCSGTSTPWVTSWRPPPARCCGVSWSCSASRSPRSRQVPALEAVLTVLRDLTANATNAVVYELLIAARTDDKLRNTLRDVLAEYSAKICDAARVLPGAEGFDPELFCNLVALLTNSFDGAAIVRAVLPQPDIEANRIPLLLTLLEGRFLPGRLGTRRCGGHHVVDEVDDLADGTAGIRVEVEAELEHVQRAIEDLNPVRHLGGGEPVGQHEVSLRNISLLPTCSRNGPSRCKSAGGISGSSRVPFTVANTR